VPPDVRVGQRFVARATVQNNGPEAIHNLSVVFKTDDWTVNRTTIRELAPGNSTVASVEMWTGQTDGVLENYTVEVADKTSSVTRLVLSPSDTWINIKEFDVQPRSLRPQSAIIDQEFLLQVVLENRGKNTGDVDLTIRCSGRGDIFQGKITVNGSSEQNLTIHWVFQERAPEGMGDFLTFRADLSGDWAGNRSAGGTEVWIQPIPSSNVPDILAGAGVVIFWIALALAAVLLMERARQKKLAQKSDRAPDINKVGDKKN
jgi:hypothetical protein